MHCLAQCGCRLAAPTAPAMRRAQVRGSVSSASRPVLAPGRGGIPGHRGASARPPPACRPARASRPGTARWAGRTGRAPWRSPTPSPGTSGRSRRSRPRRARGPGRARPRRRTRTSVVAGQGDPPAGDARACPTARVPSRAGSASTATASPAPPAIEQAQTTPGSPSVVERAPGARAGPSGRPSTGRTRAADPGRALPSATLATSRRGAERDGGRDRAVGQARAATRRRRARRPAAAAGRGRPTTSTVGRTGPGKSAWPSSSSTTASLGQGESLAPVRLGQVQPEPTLGGHLLPRRRQVGCRRRSLGHRPGLGGRAVGLEPALGGAAERLVLLGDGDRHLGRCPPAAPRPRRATARWRRPGSPAAAMRSRSSSVAAASRHDGVAVVAQVEGLRGPEHAVARPHAAVPVDLDVERLAHRYPQSSDSSDSSGSSNPSSPPTA